MTPETAAAPATAAPATAALATAALATEALATEAPACVSCGAPLHGAYCHACGEKRLDRHDYAFLHFAEHTVDTFTHLDVKVFKSLWSLLRRPGVMAADVLAGRRVRWAKPFQTFLIANLIFYLGVSAIGVSFFDATFEIQMNNAFRAFFEPLAQAKAAALGVTMEVYAERYDHLSHTLAKTFVVLLVPVAAGLLALLFWRQKRYFLEHATVAALLMSQFMLTSLLGIAAVGLPLAYAGQGVGDSVLIPVVLGANAVLFYLCFRRAYPGGAVASAVKAVAFVFGLMLSIIYLYRPVLFLLTNAFV